MSETSGGFNVDERAKQRDDEPVTVGGKQFARGRLNNKMLRERRAIGRASDGIRRQVGAAERDLEELHQADAPDEKKLKQAEELADGLQDKLLELSYRTIQLQARRGEGRPAARAARGAPGHARRRGAVHVPRRRRGGPGPYDAERQHFELMGRLARYGNVPPSEFDEMTPADARALDRAVDALIKDEIAMWAKLARLAGGG